MISERELSEYFHSFWQDKFPLLNSIFVRRFNTEHKKQLLSINGEPISPLSTAARYWRSDVTAEMAFELVIEMKESPSGGKINPEGAIRRALERMSRIQGRTIREPNSAEMLEVEALISNYGHFFDTIIPTQKIKFRPPIKGAGILNLMEGDFCTTEMLVEVKTVGRNLQSGDLRQVLCYLVAGLGSREYRWRSYCIFNPRLAVYYIGQINDLLTYLSGRTPPECISEVIGSLMEREGQIETAF